MAQGKADTVSDQVNKVGSRPGRFFPFAVDGNEVARPFEHRRSRSSIWTAVAFSKPGEAGLFLLPTVTQSQFELGLPQMPERQLQGE